MNKNEPKKSPAGDFFTWLHFAAAKRNSDIYVKSISPQKEIFRASDLSRNPPQGFFLNAFAAFARIGSEIHRPARYMWQPSSPENPCFK
ncbi:hypothetical protein ACG2F4_11085 [Halalkalibaculum sp. DA3122]|uniref:hypothetical protein n=1 Tax=Halalkalibaculum sp. DA3122 TaxID=3373607 RepID=UPI0037549495